MLFQGGALFDSKNVEEKHHVSPRGYSLKTPLGRNAVTALMIVLKRVGLENVNKKAVSELSGGE